VWCGPGKRARSDRLLQSPPEVKVIRAIGRVIDEIRVKRGILISKRRTRRDASAVFRPPFPMLRLSGVKNEEDR
jgi:hypothetical protein